MTLGNPPKDPETIDVDGDDPTPAQVLRAAVVGWMVTALPDDTPPPRVAALVLNMTDEITPLIADVADNAHAEVLVQYADLGAAVAAVRREAWFEGYDACKAGKQRRNPHPDPNKGA